MGNVLNSVNVSAHFVAETLRKSKLVNLGKAAAMLREQGENVGEFIASDPKGRQLPGYLSELANHLTNEQDVVLKRMSLLAQHLDHIKEVVNMQQTYAKLSGVTESISVTEVAEDALRLNAGALTRHEVEVVRQYDASPTIVVDKHKVLQILVNLIRNAKYACSEAAHPDRRLTLGITNGDGRVNISVSDNGMGIPGQPGADLQPRVYHAQRWTWFRAA